MKMSPNLHISTNSYGFAGLAHTLEIQGLKSMLTKNRNCDSVIDTRCLLHRFSIHYTFVLFVFVTLVFSRLDFIDRYFAFFGRVSTSSSLTFCHSCLKPKMNIVYFCLKMFIKLYHLYRIVTCILRRSRSFILSFFNRIDTYSKKSADTNTTASFNSYFTQSS